MILKPYEMKNLFSVFLAFVVLGLTACKKDDADSGVTATAYSPANNSTNVSTIPTLTITFSEDVTVGTGLIVVKNSADNTIVSSIDAATGVSLSGKVVTITGITLQPATTYYVTIPNTAFKDLEGNAFAGISNNTTWRFTTEQGVIPTMSNVPGNYKLSKITSIPPGSTIETDATNIWTTPCERDDVISLNANGTYVLTDAGTVCSPPTTDTGTWSLSGTTSIVIDGTVYNIRRFNGVNLDISIYDPSFGTITQYMIKQ
jgi:hypothetical protein